MEALIMKYGLLQEQDKGGKSVCVGGVPGLSAPQDQMHFGIHDFDHLAPLRTYYSAAGCFISE